jgi:hypothetical protein
MAATATTTTALAGIKSRLDISTTDWDTILATLLQSAVKRLYPFAQREINMQTVTPTVDVYGEAKIELSTLTTPVLEAARVEGYNGANWFDVENITHHGSELFVRDIPSTTTSLRIYGRGGYTLESSVTASTVPEHLEQAVWWYAMSEFYDYLLGNKRKYNLYTQNGARAVDNMQDQSEY